MVTFRFCRLCTGPMVPKNFGHMGTELLCIDHVFSFVMLQRLDREKSFVALRKYKKNANHETKTMKPKFFGRVASRISSQNSSEPFTIFSGYVYIYQKTARHVKQVEKSSC